jgi:PD-(D/E)XK nuclease superfamily
MSEFPVKYLSFSSCRTLSTNEFLWWNKYVRGIWRDIESVPMAVGKAVHKYLECYYMGTYSQKECETEAMRELFPLKDVAGYQKATKEFAQAVEFWLAEEPTDWGQVIHTESKHQCPLEYNGYTFPLDILAITDVVTKKEDGSIHLHDYKVVSAVKKPKAVSTDPEGNEIESDWESPEFVLQAMFNFYTNLSKFGVAPETFTFWQIKKSKNKDGSAQIVPYQIKYSEKPHYIPVFVSFIRDITLKLQKEEVWLPNFFDMMSGKEAWDEYLLYLSENQ